MCITLSPAKLSKTIIYAAEAQRDGETYHVIGYQNQVTAPKGPNAMLLPLPAKGNLGPENIIDTRKFSNILKNYEEAVDRLNPDFQNFSNFLENRRGLLKYKSFKVFDSGSYTIALADNPFGLQQAISQVPENKRPNISHSMLESLSEMYPDWPIAICCFDGNLRNPEPLLWYFKPRFANKLFAPAIDAHDGNSPDMTNMVLRDHCIAFGSYRNTTTPDTLLSFEIASFIPNEHKWMFQTSLVGSKISKRTKNGDFTIPLDYVVSPSERYLENLEISNVN